MCIPNQITIYYLYLYIYMYAKYIYITCDKSSPELNASSGILVAIDILSDTDCMVSNWVCNLLKLFLAWAILLVLINPI